VWTVRTFVTGKGRPVCTLSWGSFLEVNGRPAPLGIWVLVEQPVTLDPWQAPETWTELRTQLACQGVYLGALLDRLSPRLRDHDVPLEKRPGHLLLVGFPIPQRVGETPWRVHWLAIEMPPLSAGETFARGFRKGEKGYVLRDRGLLYEGRRSSWVPTECWEKGELSGRAA